jgi:galactokinase
MSPLRDRIALRFAYAFGASPDLIARAPGRVNLIGEHTDYNDGFVLPAAIGVETMVAAARRSDGVIRVLAADLGGAIDQFSLYGSIDQSQLGWSNYVRGMIKVMQGDGVALTGADLAISGTVPQGAGLSSSASLEVAVGHAMASLAGETIDATRLAQLAQRAESDFVGCKCGIMDQLVSARGQAGHALLIDCRSLETEPVRILDGLSIMIVHSGVSRGLVDGAYNERRAQCEAAAAYFGVAALRDVDLALLESGKGTLDALTYMRARHVVAENERTRSAAVALSTGDVTTLRELMAASHASMRDDFAITVPAIDHLVDIIGNAAGPDGGVRMTGGGFGGAVVALVKTEVRDRVRDAVLRKYKTPAGGAPLILDEVAADGVSLI